MDIQKMKTSARQATPGDWYISNKNLSTRRISSVVARSTFKKLCPKKFKQETRDLGVGVFEHNRNQVSLEVVGSSEWTMMEDRDAKFMIACNPKNVLKLIGDYEKLHARFQALQQAFEKKV